MLLPRRKTFALRWQTERGFHYRWVTKSGFKMVWMESTSPSNSLIGYSLNWRTCSLVWLKSLWQIRFFDHPSVIESPLWLTLLWRAGHGKNRSPFSAQLIILYCLVQKALFGDKYFCVSCDGECCSLLGILLLCTELNSAASSLLFRSNRKKRSELM